MGCSGSKGIGLTSMSQMTNKVDMISDRLGALQTQQDQIVSALNNVKAASDAAYQQAVRANQRINQIGHSYSK